MSCDDSNNTELSPPPPPLPFSLTQAWSNIVHLLIPNITQLESSLSNFTSILDADEVLLFERATFLVIAHSVRRQHTDIHRFEKISNIVKQFKLSCR